MKKVFCNYHDCMNEAKVMNDNKPYCINHYKEEKRREAKEF